MARRIALLAAVIGLTTTLTVQATWITIDDFDRANSSNIGPSWTQRTGAPYFQIVDNHLATPSGIAGLATHNTYMGNASGATLRFDAFDSMAMVGQSVGAVLAYQDNGANAGDYITIRIVDNGIGEFHRLFFYAYDASADTLAGWSGMTDENAQPVATNYISLPVAERFSSARVAVTLNMGVITVEVDRDFDGVVDNTYTRGGAPMPGVLVGVSGSGPATVDNFQGIPEPATIALVTISCLCLVRRKKLRA